MLYPVRIIKESFLRTLAVKRYARAAAAVEVWIHTMRSVTPMNPVQLRRAFPDADSVRVKSGHSVYVFNLRRNEFRLIAAVHFDKGRVFTLRLLTHAEYDLNRWKDEL